MRLELNTILLLIILIFISCSKEKMEKINLYADIENEPDIFIENISSVYKFNNKKRVYIKAPEALYFLKKRNNPKMEFPKGLDAIFYNDQIQPISTIHCKYAVYYEKKQLWKLSGDVVVTNPEGNILRTQELYYDEKLQTIYSIKFVEVIDKNGNIVRGKGGFSSNMDFTEYEFKNVDGTIFNFKKIEQNK